MASSDHLLVVYDSLEHARGRLLSLAGQFAQVQSTFDSACTGLEEAVGGGTTATQFRDVATRLSRLGAGLGAACDDDAALLARLQDRMREADTAGVVPRAGDGVGGARPR